MNNLLFNLFIKREFFKRMQSNKVGDIIRRVILIVIGAAIGGLRTRSGPNTEFCN